MSDNEIMQDFEELEADKKKTVAGPDYYSIYKRVAEKHRVSIDYVEYVVAQNTVTFGAG